MATAVDASDAAANSLAVVCGSRVAVGGRVASSDCYDLNARKPNQLRFNFHSVLTYPDVLSGAQRALCMVSDIRKDSASKKARKY